MSQLITSAGHPLSFGGQALTTPYHFHDTFNRSNRDLDGDSGWMSGHLLSSTYCPVGIRSNGFAASDPTNNTNPPVPPSPDYDGIGFCYRETGVTDIQVSATVLPQSTNWRECTPLLHITPDSPMMGVGAWMSTFVSLPLGWLLVSYIANPATDFGVNPPGYGLAVGTFTRSASNQTLTVRSEGGSLKVFIDGVQKTLTWVYGGTGTTSTFPVHADLQASTLHGLAVDTHLDTNSVTPDLDAPVIDEVWMSAVT